MTIQEQTAALHLVAGQTLALMDAITASVAAQVTALAGTPDATQFNSNYYIAEELHRRLDRALVYNRTALRETLKRLESLGLTGSEPPPALVLTPYGIVEQTTGFSVYRDYVTEQNIAADTATAVINNRPDVDETQKPVDVTTFYDGTHFRGALGDALLYRLTLNVTPTDNVNTATEVRLWLDYGAGVKLFEQVKPLHGGYNVAEPVTYLVPVFVGSVYALNGARLMVEADGPIKIDTVSYTVTRMHRNA